jgi:hypothetical protein
MTRILVHQRSPATRTVNALANLAMPRRAVLRLFASLFPSSPNPTIFETLHSNPSLGLDPASNPSR